jgi:hypothetical protein
LTSLDGCGWLGQHCPQVGHELVEMCKMDIVARLRDRHHMDAWILATESPCWAACSTSTLGMNHSRAACGETCKRGLARGRLKRTIQVVPRRRPTRLCTQVVPARERLSSPRTLIKGPKRKDSRAIAGNPSPRSSSNPRTGSVWGPAWPDGPVAPTAVRFDTAVHVLTNSIVRTARSLRPTRRRTVPQSALRGIHRASVTLPQFQGRSAQVVRYLSR